MSLNIFTFAFMENKKTKMGRKPISKAEKKVLIPVWVKNKFVTPATKDCEMIEKKYDKIK